MSAARVEIFLTQWCPYCQRARALLQRKSVTFTEIDIEAEPEKRAEMIERSGRRTVPQIFIDARPVGGCDDLHALDAAGELDRLLTSSTAKGTH
jgi:glutaredoxin 3